MTGAGSWPRPRHGWKPEAALAAKPRVSLVLPPSLPYPNSCPGASPHQQGRGTKMNGPCVAGVDVSMLELEVAVLPHGLHFTVTNDASGWAELVQKLRPVPIAAIGLEPSGGYERGLIRALLAAGFSVRRINPNKLRQFARARGVLAKNDRLDARLIAEYVAIMPTRAMQRDPAAERLAELVTMRRQLCDEHVTVSNQAGHLEDAMLRRMAKRRLTRLEADIALLDKRLAQMVAGDAELSRRYRRLVTCPVSVRRWLIRCWHCCRSWAPFAASRSPLSSAWRRMISTAANLRDCGASMAVVWRSATCSTWRLSRLFVSTPR